MIENVKKFHAELRIESLRNFANWIVLKNREVKIGNARTDKRVATGIAQASLGVRKGKALRFYVIVWVARPH